MDIDRDTFLYKNNSTNKKGIFYIYEQRNFNGSCIANIKGKNSKGILIYDPIIIPLEYMSDKTDLFQYISHELKLD